MWFRYNGVPSYAAGAMFMKPSDDFSHGLNERAPIANLQPAIVYYVTLIPALSE